MTSMSFNHHMEPADRTLFNTTFNRLRSTTTSLQNRQLQRDLLHHTLTNEYLINSPIISSIQPKIGKTFNYMDLENQKSVILHTMRESLLKLALQEADRDITNLTNECNITKQRLVSEVSAETLFNLYNQLSVHLINNLKLQKFRLNKKINLF